MIAARVEGRPHAARLDHALADRPGRGVLVRRPLPAVSIFGVREAILDAVSPSMRDGIAVGIGLFIAFIGLQVVHLVVPDPARAGHAQPSLRLARPDRVLLRPVADRGALRRGGSAARSSGGSAAARCWPSP